MDRRSENGGKRVPTQNDFLMLLTQFNAMISPELSLRNYGSQPACFNLDVVRQFEFDVVGETCDLPQSGSEETGKWKNKFFNKVIVQHGGDLENRDPVSRVVFNGARFGKFLGRQVQTPVELQSELQPRKRICLEATSDVVPPAVIPSTEVLLAEVPSAVVPPDVVLRHQHSPKKIGILSPIKVRAYKPAPLKLMTMSFHKSKTGLKEREKKKKYAEIVKKTMDKFKSHPVEPVPEIQRGREHIFLELDANPNKWAELRQDLVKEASIFAFDYVKTSDNGEPSLLDLLHIHTTKVTKTCVQLRFRPGDRSKPELRSETPRFANRIAYKQFVPPANQEPMRNATDGDNGWKGKEKSTDERKRQAELLDDEMKEMKSENQSEWDEKCLCAMNVVHLYTYRPGSKFGDTACQKNQALSRILPTIPSFKDLPRVAHHFQRCLEIRRKSTTIDDTSVVVNEADRYDPRVPTFGGSL